MYLEERSHGLLEPRNVGLERPPVPPRRVPVAPDLYRFFVVGGLGAHARDLGRWAHENTVRSGAAAQGAARALHTIGRPSDTLPPGLDVSPVAPGVFM